MISQSLSTFLSIGFRPFYLGAAICGAVLVPLWIATYLWATPPATAYPAYLWHMHEMLFGFGAAVMAGFLLTAVRNWTGRGTPSGLALGVLFSLWVLGRLTPFTGSGLLHALVDSAFLPALAICLAVPLWQARNLRNAFVVVILAALWGCNVTFHAAALGGISAVFIQAAITVAGDVVLLLMIVIGGRVIPAFSANAIAGLKPRTWPALEAAGIGLVLLIALLDVVRPAPGDGVRWVYTVLLYAAALAHLVRLAGWQPWRMRSNVLLLVLPLAYVWIPIHLFLRASAGGVPGMLTPAATHALFVGAMAGLMLAMMTRSALGHTGRPLRAGWAEIVCFICVALASLARVAAPWVLPDQQGLLLGLTAALWFAAFATFAFAYAPMLVRPRVTATAADQ